MEAQSSNHWIKDYIAGAIGGSSGIIVGHPFDTTKIPGFFRGLTYPAVTYGCVNAVIFGTYGYSVRWLAQGRTPEYTDIFLAGCVAGTAQLVIACPVDVIKCTLQAQLRNDASHSPRRYHSSPRQCLRAILHQHGLQGLYRGLVPMAIRDIPSYGLYLVLYEAISAWLKGQGWTDRKGFLADVIGGGMAGSFSWLSVMPCDCVKSRMQADLERRYTNCLQCVAEAVRRDGISALYRGTLVTCLRGFAASAATFIVYTNVLRQLNRPYREYLPEASPDRVLAPQFY